MKLINDYIKTLKTLGFNLVKQQPKHIKRQESNPLQISSITQERKEKILENTGTKINPRNQEHRNKYFSGLKPYKFLVSLLDEKLSGDRFTLFEGISKNFIEDFAKSIDFVCNIYQAKQIPNIYAIVPNQLNDNGKRTFITTGVSCMQGKPKSFFEVYKKTKGLQLITLEDKAGNLYGRSLLWTAAAEDKRKHYLDRIYVADALSSNDKIRAVYQAQIYNFVCKILSVDCVPCFSATHIRDIKGVNVEEGSRVPRDFRPILEGMAYDFEYFPYADTFQGLECDTDNSIWYQDGNSCEVLLTNTDGSNANDERCSCDECGESVHEDDIYYVEQEGEHLCENCCTYSDYEGTYINNNYIVEHRHTGDIMHQDNI